jgi:hypothetical protein
MSEPSADEPFEYQSPTDSAGHDVPAEDSPVPAGPATLPMFVQPWQEANVLVLRSSFGAVWPVVTGFFLFSAVSMLVAVFMLDWIGQATIALVVAVSALGLAWYWYRHILLPRVTFDKEAGQLILGWRGRRGRRPLSSVIGVQVIQTRTHFGSTDHNIPAVTELQLNLILDDPAERRLNVLTSSDFFVRPLARTVADFLGVPVLDSAGAAGAADMPMPIELATIPSPVVTQPGPDVLLIRPRRLALLSGVQLMALVPTVVLTGIGVLAAQGPAAHWSIIVLLVLMLVFSLLPLLALLPTLGRRAHFDRAEGVLTLGWLGRRRPRALASVKAVEVAVAMYGSWHELNLLSADPQQLPLNLISDADTALVRRAAERVASFLGVPLLDASRAASATAQPANLLDELSRSPLPHGNASVRGPACIVAKGADVLVLRARLRFTWPGLLPTLFTVGLGAYLIWQVVQAGPAGRVGFQQWRVWLMILILGPLAQVAALKPILLYGDRFDRQVGLLALGLFGLKGTYSLAKILAVQLVPGGLVHRTPGPFGHGGERVSYQLNLVMADVYQDRLNLTDDTHLVWTRQAAQQIAEFLGVPLLDQITDGD